MKWRKTRAFIGPGSRLSFIVALAVVSTFLHCKQRARTYENDLGIQPAVVAQIDTANYTSIRWDDSAQSFGVINEGDSVVVKFKFTNTGKTALFISAVQPSCGCIVPDYPRKPFLPGEQGELSATFNSKYRQGFIQKTILVTTNTVHNTKHLLRFSGEVRKDSLQ